MSIAVVKTIEHILVILVSMAAAFVLAVMVAVYAPTVHAKFFPVISNIKIIGSYTKDEEIFFRFSFDKNFDCDVGAPPRVYGAFVYDSNGLDLKNKRPATVHPVRIDNATPEQLRHPRDDNQVSRWMAAPLPYNKVGLAHFNMTVFHKCAFLPWLVAATIGPVPIHLEAAKKED